MIRVNQQQAHLVTGKAPRTVTSGDQPVGIFKILDGGSLVTGPNMLIESNDVATKESIQFMESSYQTNWYLEGHPPSKMEQVTLDQLLDNSPRNFIIQ